MANLTEVSRERLKGDSKYHYCPFCRKDFTRHQMDWMEHLKGYQLYYVKTVEKAERADGSTFSYYSDYYYCPRCRKLMSREEFINQVCVRSDGSPWIEEKKKES